MSGERVGGAQTATIDVFGMKFVVSDPRLAEALSTDAADRRTAEGDSGRGVRRADPADIREALPDTLVVAHRPHDDASENARRDLRERVERCGRVLGFQVAADGSWSTRDGSPVLTRVFVGRVTPVAAAYFVEAVAERQPSTTAVLFVVNRPEAAQAFHLGIRHAAAQARMRVVDIAYLEALVAASCRGMLRRQGAAALIAPEWTFADS